MSGEINELLARRRVLLQHLQAQGVSRASEHFAQSDNDADAARQRASKLEELFPDAVLRAGSLGVCRIVRTQAQLCGTPTRQGYACPVEPWGGIPQPAVWAEITGEPEWADIDPESVLYLDTETTSLATASHSYTFLIGLGGFVSTPDGPCFGVEQHFMESYADEAALVESVEAALEGAAALVTYNGRTFDLPLLEARWLLQRRRPRFPRLHLDLLHYARRLWRLRLASCSLASIEQSILGLRRLSDIDGSWVPRIYFDFQRGVHPERIIPVFDHHAQDIYSLAALGALLARAWRQPDDPRFAHASEQWGLAHLFWLRGRREEALALMESAVLAARDEQLAFRMAMQLARIYRRMGRLDDAVAIWQARLSQVHGQRLEPLIELAKYAEHTLKDLSAARVWTERALEIVRGSAELAWWREGAVQAAATRTDLLEQLARRLTRLERRTTRAASAKSKTRAGNRSRKSSSDEQEPL